MYIKNIKLEKYRNYESQEINLINGINLFVGDNAHGKTNIIESVYVCAIGKSYRTSKDNELIKIGNEYTKINLEYVKNNIDSNTEYYLDINNRKNIKKNGVKIKKISDHVGELLIVTFSPDSLDIVKGAPTKRRNFLDIMCSQISRNYLINLQEYMKCLKLKSSMLKNDIIDKDYIFVLHEKMAEYIYSIVNFRKSIIDKLLYHSKIIQKKLTDGKEEIDLKYDTDFLNLPKEEIKDILDKFLSIEIIRKSPLKGIQRDDLLIYINNLEVSKFGSQGQKRTALLTLKLANFEILKDEKEETPILLLDDIMSELDQHRINFLLQYIRNYQSIITTTDCDFVKNKENIKILKVLNGTLEI